MRVYSRRKPGKRMHGELGMKYAASQDLGSSASPRSRQGWPIL